MLSFKEPIAACVLLPLFLASASTRIAAFGLSYDFVYPESVAYRAAVMTNVLLQAKPLAYFDETYTSSSEPFPKFRGLQPDLLRSIITIAKKLDNVTVSFELEEAPRFTYGLQFNYMANDCNTTDNAIPLEDCNRLDLVVGDFFAFPKRSIKAPLTPPLLTSAAGTLQYVHRKKRQISTLSEAEVLKEPVCLEDDSWHDEATLERYPKLNVQLCYSNEECIVLLKNETCALFVDENLHLKYMVVQDPELSMGPDTFSEQYIVWPLSARLSPLKQQLLIRWILQAKILGTLDDLYDKYFSVKYCPMGKAGASCNASCSATNGLADRKRQCICDSTKWTGEDCNAEVLEDKNMIPSGLKITSYVMVSINFSAIVACAIWLYLHRETPQVQVGQPIFLSLVLLGCFISTTTILALAQEDEGSDAVPACMAIPWLYSVGFSITFGSLFAKIRRIYLLFLAAAHMQRIRVTMKETLAVVGLVLLVDVIILTIWTVVDPLTWHRVVTETDKYGTPLESQGYCASNSWRAFAAAVAALHFALMLMACVMCYISRDIPTEFAEGKYLSIAMLSNLQIFVVAIPIVIIIGNDPAGFFVRSVIIWMNDLVILFLIFGNLIWSVSLRRGRLSSGRVPVQRRSVMVQSAMRSYVRRVTQKSEASNHEQESNISTVCTQNCKSTTAKKTVRIQEQPQIIDGAKDPQSLLPHISEYNDNGLQSK